jgi:crotonobetainyl-CoA:carnitine CoA-transferase CaiB-like acyl-CoA transferase
MVSELDLDDTGLATCHARHLLALLGDATPVIAQADHPALAWRRSGLAAVTGRADGPALISPVPLTSAATGALQALAAIAPGALLPTNGAVLLGERSRLLGLSRRGTTSPNGTCRLIATRDGRIALNLPRVDDWELMPALLSQDAPDWEGVERAARELATDDLVTQGRLLGLAIAADRDSAVPPAPFKLTPGITRSAASAGPLVVDLSALWAGPLAAALLRTCGARVIKIESATRPDGARAGNPAFFDLLNTQKESVTLEFGHAADIEQLRLLVERADIVIESTRPRALRQVGIHAEALAATGKVWVSITGHGRDGDAAHWIGFGDDAAVAGGLSSAIARAWGEPLFAGDAVADPLTGITAALAAWSFWRRGIGGLISIALADVIAHARGLGEAGSDLPTWAKLAARDTAPHYPLRSARSAARSLGVDTASVLRAL